MDNKWNFPNNGGGQIRGIADAGIETFEGSGLKSISREICQNSLDASVNNFETPVKIEFKRYTISSSDIPGYEDYRTKIIKSLEYWTNSNSKTTIDYLNNALEKINSDESFVLRISDFNTTGLKEPYNNGCEGWNALVKIDGGATKSGDKGGSFGIGKNATFCNSYYRLVFYRTKNSEHEKAAQGISRFISFPENINDINNTMTTGIGYYGNPHGNLPVENIEALDDLYIRDEIGTDVFIYGFINQYDWDSEIVCEVLENFLMSIYRSQLNVIVGDNFINSQTLSKYIKRYGLKLKQTSSYYKVLTCLDTEVYEKNFHNMGTLKLRVLISPDEKLNRKVLVTRNLGMKLFDLGNISRSISFSGILEMEGKVLNEYFREMETPAHDKWNPKLYKKNPKEAKKYLDELKNWIREIVLELGEYTSDEEIGVKGLGGVLQKELSSSKEKDDKNKETLIDTIEKFVLKPKEKSIAKHGLLYGNDGKGESHTRDVDGVISDSGDSTTRTLSGSRKRSKKESHLGKASTDGLDIVHEKYGGDINLKLKNKRIIKLSKNYYRLSFLLSKDLKKGHIEIVAVGENGISAALNINHIKAIENCVINKNNENQISIKEIKKDEKVILEFSLSNYLDYAMEASIYEYN